MCDGMTASKKNKQFRIVSMPGPATIITAAGGKRRLMQNTTNQYTIPRIMLASWYTSGVYLAVGWEILISDNGAKKTRSNVWSLTMV
jgi:hypothetical protein